MDGTNLGTFATGSGPSGISFDGANIWVSNSNDNTVVKLRPSDGAILSTLPAANGPSAAAFDGARVWVTNSASHSVSRF